MSSIHIFVSRKRYARVAKAEWRRVMNDFTQCDQARHENVPLVNVSDTGNKYINLSRRIAKSVHALIFITAISLLFFILLLLPSMPMRFLGLLFCVCLFFFKKMCNIQHQSAYLQGALIKRMRGTPITLCNHAAALL